MHIRPANPDEIDRLLDIDGTIESTEYLHVDRIGEGLSAGWSMQIRPLREKLIQPNAMDDDIRFVLKQITGGAEEGLVLMAEHEDAPVALALAHSRPEQGLIHLLDLRVDYDLRRQGVATVLVYQIIQKARESELRAVLAETRTNNLPAARMLQKLGFELTGIDTHRHSNHDLVKESATLFWYAALD
jgi:ribosomal protein S18 acetylase RimI-like enzyme